MDHQSSYYVPEQSKYPLLMALAMFLTVFGLGAWMNKVENGYFIFILGFLLFAGVLWNWFGSVINENMAGLNSAQLKRSYVWGMGWFIFSEAMFFGAFFAALIYLRFFVVPDLGHGPTGELLWPGFNPDWPLMVTPDMAVNGENAVHRGPEQNMSFPGFAAMFTWLPLWNTIILLSSSVTVHIAHTAIKNNDKKKFNLWLGITVLCGIVFLFLQVEEYIHAYQELGLTLDSGIYGATFFLLTGFHGAHVTMGTIILLAVLVRSVWKNHFNSKDCFGFEAASWYWHFVDVVWLGLFILVYIFG